MRVRGAWLCAQGRKNVPRTYIPSTSKVIPTSRSAQRSLAGGSEMRNTTAALPSSGYRRRMSRNIQQAVPHGIPRTGLHAADIGDRRDVVVVQPVPESQDGR